MHILFLMIRRRPRSTRTAPLLPCTTLCRALRIADERQEVGGNELALSELDRLAAERPESYEPLSRKGDLLRAEERFDEAVEAYDGAVERLERHGGIEPRHWSLLYFRGIALERSGNWERAEADFEHALGQIGRAHV